MEKLCRDCGADLAIEDHRKYCEPYIDEEALWEQVLHDRQERRDGWQPEEAR